MKDWARSFYNSTAWQACRASYIASVDGLCERHLKRGQIVPGYIVHHKIELTPSNINDPEISMNHQHLEYVCMDCHNGEHTFGRDVEVTREGLAFDADGNLVEVVSPL